MLMPASRRKFWMQCECPIWITGRLPDCTPIERQSTGFSDLRRAEALRDTFLRQAKADPLVGPTLKECIDKYLAARESEVKSKTFGQYRLALHRLLEFCRSQNIVYIRDLTGDLLETFKVEGLPESLTGTSKQTNIWKLRCFLRAARRRKWITESLVDEMTPYHAENTQKVPFTDAEIQAIFAEVPQLDGTAAYAKYPQTLLLLCQLMLDTGMRPGDAVLFDPAHLKWGDHLWIYRFIAQKRKKVGKVKTIEVFISDELKIAIDQCQWLSTKLPFGWPTNNPHDLANKVYLQMQRVGERRGIEDCRPHRFRHTFAVRKLLAGFSLEDVAQLLGHSSAAVTERHYAAWIPSRTRLLERRMAESLIHT